MQDSILYGYTPNSTGRFDPLGWCVQINMVNGPEGQPLRATATITVNDLKSGTVTNQVSRN